MQSLRDQAYERFYIILPADCKPIALIFGVCEMRFKFLSYDFVSF